MFFLYFVLWIIFNGKITLEIIIFGLVISLALMIFTCKFTNHSLNKEKRLIKNWWRIAHYAFVLVKEIVKANIAVIRLIVSTEEEPEPAIVEFDSDLKTESARVFLANAITLTPGTITVLLENKTYTVHCLDDTFAEGMDESIFVELLSKMDSSR